MMKPKKPVFWIVIAAVALCVVVAVCLLVNPKDYGPEVGNPQMLELPGVAWFATPDEVKEALNISEEQIVAEYKTSGYILNMDAKDFTLFGRDIVYASFGFWFGPDGDTALRYAEIYFSEDTNMEKLEKELVEIYGPSKSESDFRALYDYDIPRVKQVWPSLFALETSAKNENGYNALDGNPFQDALEDPDYIIRNWVLVNGLSAIPEEAIEHFKSVEAENLPQDEAALTKLLDRLPWITMTMSNRNAQAIYREASGRVSGSNHFYTNNYIAFDARLLALYLLKIVE